MITLPTRPVMRYHGGKFGTNGSIADRIVANLPPHRIYVEPFGGVASVLLRKPRVQGEVYNDKWGGVVTVFKVLRDPKKAAELERRIRLTPFARDEFKLCSAEALAGVKDPIEFSRRIIFRSFAGFGSGSANPAHATGFRSNSMRSGTTPAHDWANFPDVIRSFTARLQGVTIENKDAISVMLQHDSEETLHYGDPPYVHSTRKMGNRYCKKGYVHELVDEDHRKLAEVLHQLRGMVVLSGYNSPLYEELYGSWERVEYTALADRASKRTEVLWFNPLAWEGRCRAQTPLLRAMGAA